MIIQPPFGGCLRLLIAIPIAKTAPHRYAPTAPCIAIQKTAEKRLYMLARGWLAYPVTSTHSQLPPKLYSLFYTTALRRLPSPSDLHPHRKNRPTSVCANGTVHRRMKTAEERLYTLARGWLAYPVTPTHSHLPPKSGYIC